MKWFHFCSASICLTEDKALIGLRKNFLSQVCLANALLLGSLAPTGLALSFTNTPVESWRYSELVEASPNDTTFFPSSTNEYAAATFQGYVTFEENPGSGPLILGSP